MSTEHELRELRQEFRELRDLLVQIQWAQAREQTRQQRDFLLLLEILRDIRHRLPKPTYPRTGGGSITVE